MAHPTHHGSHFDLQDSHHTTVDLNLTHVDSNNACGHGTITTHPFPDHSPLSGFTTSAQVDGCIHSNGSDWSMTGPSGFGQPNVSVGVGFNF